MILNVVSINDSYYVQIRQRADIFNEIVNVKIPAALRDDPSTYSTESHPERGPQTCACKFGNRTRYESWTPSATKGHSSYQTAIDLYGHLWKDRTQDKKDAEALDSKVTEIGEMLDLDLEEV